MELSLPMIRAMSLTGVDATRPLLTEQQRRRLAAVATMLQLPARAIISFRNARSFHRDPAGGPPL